MNIKRIVEEKGWNLGIEGYMIDLIAKEKILNK
jgi:hypothetical protein